VHALLESAGSEEVAAVMPLALTANFCEMIFLLDLKTGKRIGTVSASRLGSKNRVRLHFDLPQDIKVVRESAMREEGERGSKEG
jgi:hypothetical protein